MKKRKKVNIAKVRREIGKMFKKVKGRVARKKAMKEIWRKYK